MFLNPDLWSLCVTLKLSDSEAYPRLHIYGQMILLSANIIALFLLFICHIYFSFIIIIALAMYYNTIV